MNSKIRRSSPSIFLTHLLARYWLVVLVSGLPFASYGWDLTSELTIKSTSGALNGEPTSRTTFLADQNGLTITITSTFYAAGKFEKPWMSIPNNGMATLHVATEKSSGFFSSKEEFIRQITIQIARSRLPKGTTLYIYNDDIEEVIGQITAR